MTFVEADGLCWIGELEIPSLQLTLPVADPWSYPSLKKAPCRYTGSAEENSLIIAAHNYKSAFWQYRTFAGGCNGEVYSGFGRRIRI